jgi:hypothetical protein
MLKILLWDIGTCRTRNSNCKFRHAFRPLHGSKGKEKEKVWYRPRSLPPLRPTVCVTQFYVLSPGQIRMTLWESLVSTGLNSTNHSSLLLHHLHIMGLVSLISNWLENWINVQENNTADHSGRAVFGTKRLRPLEHWDRGYEPVQGMDVCMSTFFLCLLVCNGRSC